MELNPQLDTSIPGGRDGSANFVRNLGGPRPVADRDISLDRFAGWRDPKTREVRKFEQPWHRAAAYHYASAKMSLKAISEACDVCYKSVLDLAKNPWWQETVNEIMAKNGAQDVMDLFKAEQVNSLVTLIEIRDNDKVPSAVRRASAVDILDRYMGKPTQRIETAAGVAPLVSDPVAEVARLEEENRRLRGTSPTSPQGEPSTTDTTSGSAFTLSD